MYNVYLLISEKDPSKSYIGYTKDIEERVRTHNFGQSEYTLKFKPWKLLFYAAFQSSHKAKDFEKYLKSGSGKEFVARHFL